MTATELCRGKGMKGIRKAAILAAGLAVLLPTSALAQDAQALRERCLSALNAKYLKSKLEKVFALCDSAMAANPRDLTLPEQIAKRHLEEGNGKLAVSYFEHAAALDSAMALRVLTTIHLVGILDVPPNFSIAKYWAHRAGEVGDSDALVMIGTAYLFGSRVERDYVEAERWSRRAADMSNPHGENNLGLLYLDGLGVEKDEVLARQWFQKAANRGDKLAQTNLGHLYEQGIGGPQSDEEALRWYRLAAEQGDAEARKGIRRLEQNP